jgi:hypothetical protein
MPPYPSFGAFMEEIVLPLRAAYPSYERLDGQPTGGNRDSAGEFTHAGRMWRVHADTHLDRLMAAYEALTRGTSDPFVEQPTPRGNSLDLRPELKAGLHSPRRKYLYIYEM